MKQHYPNHTESEENGSKRNSTSDHRTPRDLFDALDRDHLFTLDAAASEENALCERFFSITDSALEAEWGSVEHPARVWLNPPYSRDLNGGLGAWFAKAAAEVRSGRASVVWVLVPARCCTRWFHDALRDADECRLIEGRLNFTGPHQLKRGESGQGAPFPSALFRFGSPVTSGECTIRGADRQGRAQPARYDRQPNLERWC